MFLKIMCFPLIGLIWLSGCSPAEKNAERQDVQHKGKKAVRPATATTGQWEMEKPPVFYAKNFSDDQKWLKGIDVKQKNVFFFSMAKTSPTPLTAGCRLRFAAAGEAEVRSVYRLEKPDKSSIFIKVDTMLDPDHDGYPHPILLKNRVVVASRYSKEPEWRNGINLKKPGLFFFSIKENELVPVKKGDRLKFLKSGDARVKQVTVNEAKDRKFSILVTVDRTLDPDKDGFPNPISVSFDK
jgi:hypothetical protein